MRFPFSAGVRLGAGVVVLVAASFIEAAATSADATTASGQAAVTLRIRPPRGVHGVRIALTARDAVGNESTASRSVRIR
jgi:hypothetical protein